MSRFHRSAALAALTVAAVACAGAASAQTYNRLVVFGDSLSDNGNLLVVTGGTQPDRSLISSGFGTRPIDARRPFKSSGSMVMYSLWSIPSRFSA